MTELLITHLPQAQADLLEINQELNLGKSQVQSIKMLMKCTQQAL